ncbi:serine hydrolase domain-containing protein [Demequina globuliformis]|uniref:serine hydrolase domain-containing protein n=1 Tax=Demequina globuliformis TaxID=676202 RepID=UPI00078150D3|nr:serine hydrolase [Demequina globuliformis]
MSRKAIAALISLVVLVIALVAAYWYARPLLMTGTGYAAHNACALDVIAGRDDAATDLPPNPLVPVVRTEVAEDGASAEGSILGILARQTAWEVPGYGCALADESPATVPPATAVTPGANPYTDLPLTEPTDSAMVAALAHGFGDDLDAQAQEELGTRAMVVVHDGRLVAERYADGFDESTPQLGWSMTKSVTNLLVGRLVEQGDLSLDDDHLRADWTDRRADITIRHLLNMTSGLAWDETYDLGTPITQMLYAEPDMGAFVASQELAHDPGSFLQYSSGSTTLLCDVITEGRGLADMPRQELFTPLGLSSAVMEADAAGTPVCSSYMWASARDWAAVGQFALQEGQWEGERLLPEGWMEESTAPIDTVVEEGSDGYASGWWANTSADGTVINDELPADAYFASGHDGQRITVVPSEGIVVLRLGFTPTAEDNRVVSSAAQVVEALS